MSSPNTDDDSPFKTLIQKDSDICNNCFRQTHDTYERNYAVDTVGRGEEQTFWAREVDLPDRSWTIPGQTCYIPSEPSSQGTFVSCVCGIGDSLRPVQLDVAMEYGKRICERLAEKDVEFDEDRLLDTLREEMQKPENQGKQDTVFSVAVNEAMTSWTSNDSDAKTSVTS